MAWHVTKKAAIKILIQKLCLQTWRSICLFCCHSELQRGKNGCQQVCLPSFFCNCILDISMIPIIFSIYLFKSNLAVLSGFSLFAMPVVLQFFIEFTKFNLFIICGEVRTKPEIPSNSSQSFKIYSVTLTVSVNFLVLCKGTGYWINTTP